MAKGSSLPSMESEVGFVSLGSKNPAVDNLEEQERGGTIDDREFIPIDSGSRSRGKADRNVVKRSQLRNLPEFKDVSKQKGKNRKQRMYLAALKGKKGDLMLTEDRVIRIDKISSNLKTRGTKVKFKMLYSFKENRKVKVEKTGFMKTAANWSASDTPRFFKEQFEREFKKFNI